MKIDFKKLHAKLVLSIPVIFLISIIMFSCYLLEKDKELIYKSQYLQTETITNAIANRMEYLVNVRQKSFDDIGFKLIERNIEDLNQIKGVYCFLCDTLGNFLTGPSEFACDIKISQEIQDNITKDNLNGERGYINMVSKYSKEDLKIYYKAIDTSVDAELPNYYIVSTCSKDFLQSNEAVSTFKLLVGLLTILCSILSYIILYNRSLRHRNENKSE